MMLSSKGFVTLLRSRRQEKNLTLKQLSNITGYQPSYLCDIENEFRNPPNNSEFYIKISKALEIELKDLLEFKAYITHKENCIKRVIKIIKAHDLISQALHNLCNDLSDKDIVDKLLKVLDGK